MKRLVTALTSLGRWCYEYRLTGAWYHRNFLRGFCYYWPLLTLFILPLALMGGAFADYGPRHLFFHDCPLKGFIVGATVFLFCTQVLFISYLVWLRDLREGRLGQPIPEEKPTPQTAPLLPLTFLPYVWRIVQSLGLSVLAVLIFVGISANVLHVLPVVNPSEKSATLSLEEPVTEEEEQVALPPSIWERAREIGWIALKYLAVPAGAIVAGCLLAWSVRRSRPCTEWIARKTYSLARSMHWRKPRSEEPNSKRPRRWVRWAGYLSTGVLLFAWVWFLVPFALGFERGWTIVGPLLFMVLGFLLTVVALIWKKGFWLALFANLGLMYAIVTWVISKNEFGALAGLTAGIGWCFILGSCLRVFFPARWRRTWQLLADTLSSLREQERQHLGWGMICLAMPTLVLMVMLVPMFASPAPIILGALSGVVGLYGLTAYTIRRSFIVLVGWVLLFTWFAHIQGYKMRFAPLLDHYSEKRILNLPDEVNAEWKLQRAFNDTIAAYQLFEQDAEGILESLKLAADAGDGIQDAVIQHERETTARRNEFIKNLKEAWLQMEQNNHIRAPHVASAIRDDHQELVKALEMHKTRLLSTENLDRHPSARPASNRSKPDLVVIAVSGGGIRAAVWTFVVLSHLERAFAERGVDFPAHVRLITGASGGMVGASYYIASLPEPENRPPSRDDEADKKNRYDQLKAQQRALGSDFLTPLVKRAVLSDLPSWLSPWPLSYDRGLALEQAWSRSLGGALDVSFKDLRDSEQKGWRPSLIFTPMLIEDGRRLLISNLDLRYPISNDGWVLASKSDLLYRNNHSIEALELFRLFQGAEDRFTLATAARMSASFPFFSPAVSLPTRPRRRVVDAGYYDNYGVSLATSWLFSRSNQPWIREKFDRIVLIQIRDGQSEDERQLQKLQRTTSTALGRSTEEITAPPEGLYTAQFASSSFRNDGLLELYDHFDALMRLKENLKGFARDKKQMKQYLEEQKQVLSEGREPTLPRSLEEKKIRHIMETEFMVMNFELDEPASTSWYLTDREKTAITRTAAGKLKEKITRLLEWWAPNGT